MIRPRALLPGMTIGLTAPSGALRSPQSLDKGIDLLESLGFKTMRGRSCDAAYGYLAGSDALRAEELNAMFADPRIDAIWCVRGGYGALRILDRLDYDLAQQCPKPLIGFSDITALHAAYWQRAGLVTFHGPMLAFAPERPMDALGMEDVFRTLCHTEPNWNLPTAAPLQTLQGGRAVGPLVGGNLSLLAALCGTPYAPDARGAILFLEEIGEYTYCVDRMLTQLRLSGLLDACAGILLGGFTDCNIEHPGHGLSLTQIFEDILLPTGKPILAGLPCGHCTPNMTLPMGAPCAMDADAQRLTFLEPPVLP